MRIKMGNVGEEVKQSLPIALTGLNCGGSVCWVCVLVAPDVCTAP